MKKTTLYKIGAAIGELRNKPGVDEPTRYKCAEAVMRTLLIYEERLFQGNDGKRRGTEFVAMMNISDHIARNKAAAAEVREKNGK